MQQQDNHEYPFLYQRQTCHQVQPIFFQAEDGIRGLYVTGVQTCALPIYPGPAEADRARARQPPNLGGAPRPVDQHVERSEERRVGKESSRGSISTSTLPSIKLRKCSSKIITSILSFISGRLATKSNLFFFKQKTAYEVST